MAPGNRSSQGIRKIAQAKACGSAAATVARLHKQNTASAHTFPYVVSVLHNGVLHVIQRRVADRAGIVHHADMAGDRAQFCDAVKEALRRWEMAANPKQLETFCRFHEAVVEANRSFNLTRIVDPLESAVKHFADSLSILRWVETRGLHIDSVVDIGTGAGFPAVPIAIMRPAWNVTAIDSTRKKVNFLRRAATELNISNLHVEHAHSAHWKPATGYQLAVLRAVGKLDKCLTPGARCLSPGGWLVVFKTFPLAAEEIDAARAVLERLKLREQDCFEYELEYGGDTMHRALYVFQRRA